MNDDLTKMETDLTAEAWKEFATLEKRLATLHRTLQNAGPGSSATTMAGIVAETAANLLQILAKAEGFASAVRLM